MVKCATCGDRILIQGEEVIKMCEGDESKYCENWRENGECCAGPQARPENKTTEEQG